MSDFESRLTEALTSGAEEAPAVDRLADGARARASARRRTRTALVAVVAVVALGVPVGVVALTAGGERTDGGDRVATDGPEQAPDDWHTIEHEGVLVDVPGGWGRLDTSSCEFQWTRFGPAGSDPCGYDGEGLSFYGSATFDPATGPGLFEAEGGWAGYVYTGEWAIYATVGSRDQGRRILGSARTSGQQAPDLSAGFKTASYVGLAIDVPADWEPGSLSDWCADTPGPEPVGRIETPDTRSLQIACRPRHTYGVRFGGGDADDWIRERHEPAYPEGSWAGVAIVPDEAGEPIGYVQVVAPTQGLAELIGGSLRVQ